MRICKRTQYRGTVQGVGFRMTAQRIAHEFAVTGFVRNLPDGCVEIVAAGEGPEVNAFLGAVAECMASYIQGIETADAAEQSFASFEIRI